ncbi:hypothetical protein GCM10009765_73190 [Fodinicola feengrottensis]|uniref:Uncharacterized protein n=1 Tax=Fodinicola feengrottensis TaxID=435914 RepID=A0ABN2IWY2_9ACTN
MPVGRQAPDQRVTDDLIILNYQETALHSSPHPLNALFRQPFSQTEPTGLTVTFDYPKKRSIQTLITGWAWSGDILPW